MRKEIADKWVAALRSGEYKQGKFALNSNNSFCCLGVLCELAKKEGIVNSEHVKQNSDYMSYFDPRHDQDRHSGLLPRVVSKWADIKTSAGYVYPVARSLLELNDGGQTFEYIADVIENNYESI